MDDPNLLKLISVYMSEDVLKLVSETVLYEDMRSLFLDQHWWYLRAQTLVNFELAWEPDENWHQVYNILLDADKINPFSRAGALGKEANGFNLTGVKLLLRLGFDPSVDDSFSLQCAVNYGSLEAVKLLLSDSRVSPVKRRLKIISRAVTRGSVEVAKLVLNDKRIRPSLLHDVLEMAAAANRLDMVEMLLQDSRFNKPESQLRALRIAIRDNRVEMVKLILSNKDLIIGKKHYISGLKTQDDHVDLVAVLVSDERIDPDGAIVVRMLNNYRRLSPDMIDALLQSKNLDVDRLAPFAKRGLSVYLEDHLWN